MNMTKTREEIPQGPIYEVTVTDDPRTTAGAGRWGSIVLVVGDTMRGGGRYDFDTEESARAWGRALIAQCEDIRLHPEDINKLGQYAEQIRRKGKS